AAACSRTNEKLGFVVAVALTGRLLMGLSQCPPAAGAQSNAQLAMPMWVAHGWEFQTCAPKSVPAAREFAAKAAARRLPLKRRYDISSLTSAEPRVDSRSCTGHGTDCQIHGSVRPARPGRAPRQRCSLAGSPRGHQRAVAAPLRCR